MESSTSCGLSAQMVMDGDAIQNLFFFFASMTKVESRYGVTSVQLHDEDGVSVTAPDVFCSVFVLLLCCCFSLTAPDEKQPQGSQCAAALLKGTAPGGSFGSVQRLKRKV